MQDQASVQMLTGRRRGWGALGSGFGAGASGVAGMTLGTNLGFISSEIGAYPFANVLLNSQFWQRFSGVGSFTTGVQGDLTATVGTDEFRSYVSDAGVGLPAGTYTVWNPSAMNIAFGTFSNPAAYYPYSTATGAGGTVTFSYPGGAGLFMFVKGSTSRASGAAALLLPGTFSAWQGGNIWNPDFITFQNTFGARVLRFMDWTQMSSNIETDFADRTVPDRINLYNPIAGGSSIPYEYIVDLCNRLGKDPWIPIPVRATSAYVTAMTNLLNAGTGAVGSVGNAGLSAGRAWWMEQGNEIWNSALPWRNGTGWVSYYNHTKYTPAVNATTDVLTLTAHTFVNGDQVQSWNTKQARLNGLMDDGTWYQASCGSDTLYVGVIDVNTFKLYTDVARTLVYDFPVGVTEVILAKTTQFAAAVDANYGALAKARWDIADPIMGVPRVKHLIAAQAFNDATTQGRLAVTGVAARTDYVAIAPYFEGEYMAGQIAIATGSLTPKFWCKVDGTLYINFFPAGTAKPSDAALIAGTGALQHQQIAYTKLNNAYTAGTAFAGTNGTNYKCFMTFVNGGESRTVYYWTIETTQAPSATASTVTFFDTADQQLSRNKLDTDIDNLANIAAHKAKIAASANTNIKLICYEGGNHMGGDLAPAEIADWVRNTYMVTAQYREAMRHNLRTLASRGVMLHCWYTDIHTNNFTLANTYANFTDPRIVQMGAYSGVVSGAAGVAIADVIASNIQTAPTLPYTVYTFPATSLTYTLLGGDTAGNYAMVGNALKMVATTGINFASPAAVNLKVRAADADTDSITTVSFFTGNAWWEVDALWAWDSIADTVNTTLDPVVGAVMPITAGTGATIAAGYWTMNGTTYSSTTGMTSVVDLVNKNTLIAFALDNGGEAGNFVTGWQFGGGSAFIRVYKEANNFRWEIYNGTTDTATGNVVAADATKRVVWLFHNTTTGKIHYGQGQTQTNPGGSAGDAPPATMPTQLDRNMNSGTRFEYGSGEVVNRAGMTLADALAIVQKIQTKHGI